jgi:membrane fusion protein (multidrug efflux system)
MRVEVDLPNPDARLLHGTYVHVKLELEARPDLLVVPASALMTEGKERFVYVIREERAVRVPVKTGLDDGGAVEITAGLNEGDELVADGRAVRAPNAPVRPRSASRG